MANFNIYYSNLLETQKDILLYFMQNTPLTNPLDAETILVQSPGMEQWLNWQIAQAQGVAANINYPMPASFIWQLYRDNLPNVEEQSALQKDNLIWRLMRLLPELLPLPAFAPLRGYLQINNDHDHREQDFLQLKTYQLAYKIADLFDQYLVYRPDWIRLWEGKDDTAVLAQFQQNSQKWTVFQQQISEHLQWQACLWRAVIADIQQENARLGLASTTVLHRANLHQAFLSLLAQKAPENLPKRLFIFGISALPLAHLQTLQALSQYCDVHLFFTNGCQAYWGDVVDAKLWQKALLRQRLHYDKNQTQQEWQGKDWLTAEQVENINSENSEITSYDETLAQGNPLLAMWGKMGRDFLYLLTEMANAGGENFHIQEIEAYVTPSDDTPRTLLQQVQDSILHFAPNAPQSLQWQPNDESLTIHNCYSPMREVEALYDYLLRRFNNADDPMFPKDVVVMVANIDAYTPYIQAVFGQNEPHIPFAIADKSLTETDVVIANFLHLLALKESEFSAEEILAFLDVPTIRQRFGIQEDELEQIHFWVKNSGVRYGLSKEKNAATQNYNAWLAGLERLLLGFSLREQDGLWEGGLALDGTDGMQEELAGKLAQFIHKLWHWQEFLTENHRIEEWQNALDTLITDFLDETQQGEVWRFLSETFTNLREQVEKGDYQAPICAEVIAQKLNEALQIQGNNYRFTLGKVNFCTLMPMRSVPFKVVCLLGMNDGEYPRVDVPNSFDLMQYHHQKGDRFRRDDDRYLFLEALLSAQDTLYISYVGRSIVDDSVKEPSVLVSQLLGYLVMNLSPDQMRATESEKLWYSRLVREHAMNVFSAKNFQGDYPSFARNWLAMAQPTKPAESLPFLDQNFTENSDLLEMALNQKTGTEIVIEWDRLLAFLQHPLKYFFEKQLGCYFDKQTARIAESENFALDNLSNYWLDQDLLTTMESHASPEDFWQKWTVKGVLPRGVFGELQRQENEKNVAEFMDFCNQNIPETTPAPQDISIPLSLAINESTTLNLRLVGYLADCVATPMGEIFWQDKSLRSLDSPKRIIQAWLAYLCLLARSEFCEKLRPALIIGKTNKGFDYTQISLAEPSADNAKALLQRYVSAFLLGQRQPCLVPSPSLMDWLSQKEKDADTMVGLLSDLSTKKSHSHKHDIYWQRLGKQQDLSAFSEPLAEEMQIWFGKLNLNGTKKGSKKKA